MRHQAECLKPYRRLRGIGVIGIVIAILLMLTLLLLSLYFGAFSFYIISRAAYLYSYPIAFDVLWCLLV
jgi:hypothetical protein